MAKITIPGSGLWSTIRGYLNSMFTELYGIVFPDALRVITALSDLPAPVAGVINLPSRAYMFLGAIDLAGNRIVCDGACTFYGTSSENSSITSTGLGAGLAMITSTYTLAMQFLTITSPSGAKAFDLQAASATYALDWTAVNLTDCEEIGLISGYSNFIYTKGAFLGSSGIVFDDTIGTISFSESLISNPVGTAITVPSTAVISRRFKIIHSSFVITSGNTGVNFSTSASIPNDSYIFEDVNFSGGGTYITGVLPSDNKSRFDKCKGVENSATDGFATMVGNATATTISSISNPVKIAGTFTLEAQSQRFSLVSNKLVCQSALIKTYEISISATLLSTNNNVIGLYVAKNDSVVANSVNQTTANGAGRAENAYSRTVLELQFGDTIDAWTRNFTALNAVTGQEVSILIKEL